MISFRFHLLSLTAVFLALGVGIAVGATVVDRATVEALQNRLNDVEQRVRETDRRNGELRADVGQWARFAEQAGDELVEGRLPEVPVLVLAVRGFDKGTLDRLRQSLTTAGANLHGTLWLTSKLRLDKQGDVNVLSQLLGIAGGRPDELRRAVVTRLASSWAGSGEANPLAGLLEHAFLEYEAPGGPGPEVDPRTLPRAGTRFVVASGPRPDVPNELLATPLAGQLARTMPTRVLAVEPGGLGREAEQAGFVSALRTDGQVGSLLASVDNVADFRGRVAAVLALADLGRAKAGHYGTEARATRLVPESAP